MGGGAPAAGAMKFCSEGNNILYPKEDAANRRLLLKCHNCDHQELAEDYMVFRNEVHHSTAERTLVLTDVVTDPTPPAQTRWSARSATTARPCFSSPLAATTPRP